MRVSHETIYRALYVQARGTLKRELTRPLRTGRGRRFARSQSSKRQGQGKIAGMVMISERPPEVEDRAVPGHWEGDLLMGGRTTRSRPWSSAPRATASSSPCPRGPAPSRSRMRSRRASPRCRPSFAARSPGTRARRWQSTGAFRSRPACRSTSATPKPLAAGLEREHQRPPSPVLPEGQEPRRGEPGAPRRGRCKAQPSTAPDARLSDPGREARRADRRPRSGRRRALTRFGLRPSLDSARTR